MNPPSFDGVEDCAHLPELHNSTVLHNLRKRYATDLIYTYSGLFLVAINPYKNVPIYTPKIADLYRGKRKDEVAPHIFAISDYAYRQMLDNQMNQSMLITGESGAGKTENTKKVIQYIAQVAGRSGGVGELETQLIELNPVLEAFGNAKTTRNNNSSRFGKFIKLQFNHGGLVSGASVRVYLLEKSRVIDQLKGERNFHIFYQLLLGATAEEKKNMLLDAPEAYYYLKHSSHIDGWNDVEEFKHTKVAMKSCGISPSDQADVFKIVAGILHLGNTEFGAGPNDQATLKNKLAVKNTAELFMVNPETLEKALLKPRIEVGSGKAKELVSTHLTKEKAEDSRDAMAKSVYNRLFLWIVNRMNKVLAKPDAASFIGVLDIAGFEIFEKNTFEQLCINYTNERLQQFFNNYMFKLEQEEYERERIEWKFINFGVDSQMTIDLIARPPYGILKILDEECLFPNGTDHSFMEKMDYHHKNSPKWARPKTFEPNTFFLKHYAGEVKYDTSDWVMKNKDPLQKDLVQCLKTSKNKIVFEVFGDQFDALTERDASPSSSRSSSPATKGGKVLGGTRGAGGAQFQFVAKKYDAQLTDLMDVLGSTQPHFVRCILPNYKQRPNLLNGPVVQEQLRYNGVLEGIRISRMGFPNRVMYADFLKRYHLLGDNIPRQSPDPKSEVQKLMKTLIAKKIIDPAGSREFKNVEDLYRFGLTKVFFRAGQLTRVEGARQEQISALILTIQASCRGWIARNMFKKLRLQSTASKVVKKNLRAYLDFRDWAWWKLFVKVRPLLEQKKHKDEIKERELKIKELASDLERKKKEQEDLASRLNDVQSTLETVKKDYDEESAKYQEAEKNRAALQAELDALSAKMKTLDEELEDEMKVNNDLAQLKKKLDEKVLALEDDLDEASAERDALSAKVRDLERAKGDLESSTEGLAEQLASLKASRNNMESSNKELLDQLDECEEQIRKLTAEVSSLKGANEEIREIKEDLAAKNAALDKKVKKGEVAQKDLEAQIAEQKTLNEKAENTLSKLKSEVDSLSAQLNDTEGGAAESEKRNKKLKLEIDDLRAELDEAEARVKSKDNSVKDLERQLAELNEDLNTAETDREALELKSKGLDSKVEQLTSELNEKEAELTTQQRELKARQDEIATLHTDLDAAEADIARVEKDKKKIEGDLADTQQQLEEEKKDKAALQKLIKKLKAEIAALKQQLADEQAAHNTSRETIKKLEAELKEYQDSLASGAQKEQMVSKSLKNLQQQIDDLKNELEGESQSKAKLQSDLKAKQTEIDELNDDVADANAEKERLNADLRTREAELATLKKEVAAREEAVAKEAAARKLAEAKILEAENRAADENTRALDLESAKKSKDQQIQDLQAEVDRHKAEAEKLKKADKKRGKAENELKAQVAALTDQNLQLEANLRKTAAQLAEVEGDSMGAQGQLDAVKKQVTSLESEVKNLQSELEAARAGQTKAQREAASLKSEVEELMDELETSRENADARREVALKQDEINNLKFMLDQEVESRNRADAARKQSEGQNNDLRSQLDASEKARADLDKKVRGLVLEANEAGEKTEAAEREKAKLAKEKKKLSGEVKALRQQLEQNMGMVPEEELRHLQNAIEDLKDQLDVAVVGKEVASKQATAYQQELESLREQLETEMRAREKAVRDVKRLDEEVESEKDRVEELEEQVDSLEDWKMRHQTAVDQANMQIQALTDDKIKNEDEIKTLQLQLDESRNVLDNAIAQKNKMEQKLKALSGQSGMSLFVLTITYISFCFWLIKTIFLIAFFRSTDSFMFR